MPTGPDPHPAPAADREFAISRVFDAPRELVFGLWTDPVGLARWWGPHGSANDVVAYDVRPGGAYRIVMRGPDGIGYPFSGVFHEVVAPERLVSTIDCSEHPPEWHDLVDPRRDRGAAPRLAFLQTATFETIGGRTLLTVRTCFDTAAVRDALVRIGMGDGWSQSMERLAAAVAALPGDTP